MKLSIYERITNQIAEAIENGAPDYVMPWHRNGKALDCPRNAVSGRNYRGLNILTLWIGAEAHGFSSGQWATYQQWASIGAQVRKGERGTGIFFWQSRQTDDAKESGEHSERRRPGFIAKAFNVFNADQVSGYNPEVQPVLSETERNAHAEVFLKATGAEIRQGGDRAYFSTGFDRIHIPDFGQFLTASGYYSVLAHELTHWTGAQHRLDRNLASRFGSYDYAMEELVAELGAAFTCARLGLNNEPRRDHAPYIVSWLKALREDNRAIFTAASKAQEACDLLFGDGKPRSD
jgi:antirestriction protein ArdC